MKNSFHAWLSTPIEDATAILAGKLESLRLNLTDAMREMRQKSGLTQKEIADKMNTQEADAALLESALVDKQLDPLVEYFNALDAEFIVAVKQGDNLIQLTDTDELLVVVPNDIQALASAKDLTVQQYVQYALEAQLIGDNLR